MVLIKHSEGLNESMYRLLPPRRSNDFFWLLFLHLPLTRRCSCADFDFHSVHRRQRVEVHLVQTKLPRRHLEDELGSPMLAGALLLFPLSTTNVIEMPHLITALAQN